MNTKVAFINPPFLEQFGRYSREQRSPAITKSGTFYYPMWLSYAAGYLEKAGYGVMLLDAVAGRISSREVESRLLAFRPHLIVLATSTPSIHSDVMQAASLKAALPDAFVTLLGVHVTALPKESLVLGQSVDAVVVGEYEQVLAELAGRLESGANLDGVPGLVYRRGEDGAIVDNGPQTVISDLDSIPWVTRTYRKHLDYRNYFYSGNRYPVVVFVTARGCPNRCIFCVYPQTVTGRAHRTRSIGDVVDEMEYVVRDFPRLGEIMFEDDTFTADKERTVRFAEEVLRRGLKVRWSCNARADLDLDLMVLMRKAGCRSLLVGFESGSQTILDRMKKNNNLDRYRRFIRDSKKAGLLVNGAFLVGMPGETQETMKQTLDMARSLNPDVAQFFPVMVYPGTEIYEIYRERGYLVSDNFRDWLTDEGLHNCVVNLPGVTHKEMVRFCDSCRRSFYLRPRYVLYKIVQGLRDPEEGIRTVKAARLFARHLFYGSSI